MPPSDTSTSSTSFLAALYLEAVLPVVPDLAAHDSLLAASLAGPDVAVTLKTSGDLRARLAITGNQVRYSTDPQSGDLRLWFPTPAQLVRAFDGRGRPAFALPTGGFHRLLRARRLVAAGDRLNTLLNNRTNAPLALHAWGNLLVGIHAVTTWLRHHPADRARFPSGVLVLSCPAFPDTLHLDLATLTVGTGEPAAPATARITFADLATVLAELDHQLDAPAALGLGTLRVEGHVPFAENLSLLMLKAGNLLKPS